MIVSIALASKFDTAPVYSVACMQYSKDLHTRFHCTLQQLLIETREVLK